MGGFTPKPPDRRTRRSEFLARDVVIRALDSYIGFSKAISGQAPKPK